MATAVLPPSTTGGGKSTTTTVSTTGSGARPVSAQAGQVVSVADDHGAALATQSWQILGTVGPSSQRPVSPTVVPNVPMHVDTTLGKIVVWDGTSWRDPVTGKVV